MIDCGSSQGMTRIRAAERLARHLDASKPISIVVTHADADHLDLLAPTERAPSVLGDTPVRSARLGGFPEQYDTQAAQRLLTWLAAEGVTPQWLTTNDVSQEPLGGDLDCGGAEIRLIAAGVRSGSHERGLQRNTPSAVLLLSYAGRRVLLTGDATHETEAFILERHDADALDVDVLKVGHHGAALSTISLDDSPWPWLDTVDPEHLIFSAGHHGGYRHPRCVVMDAALARDVASAPRHPIECHGDGRWQTRSTRSSLWSTHSDGDIEVSVGPEGDLRVQGNGRLAR